MGVLQRLREYLTGGSTQRRTGRHRVGEDDLNEVADDYKRQTGSLKAEVSTLEEENAQLREELQEKERQLRQANVRRARARAEQEDKIDPHRPQDKKNSLDLLQLAYAVDDGAEVMVVSRNHKPLGYFAGVQMVPVGNQISFHIMVSEEPGRRGRMWSVIDGHHLQKLVHRPEHIVDALQVGMLVVNREKKNRTPVPDPTWIEHGEERHIEDKVQEMEQKIQNLRGKLKEAEQRAEQEAVGRQMQEVETGIQKARADATQEGLLADVRNFVNYADSYRRDKDRLYREETRNNRLDAYNKQLENTIDSVYQQMSDRMSKDEFQHARQQLIDDYQKLEEIGHGNYIQDLVEHLKQQGQERR